MQRTISRILTRFAAPALLGLAASPAWADRPVPWQMWMQAPATPVADRIESLHVEVVYIITAITLFVLGLLLYVCWRYSARNNPVPSRTSHNTVIEIAWTLVPIVILGAIVVPSFKLLFFQETIPTDSAMTLKVKGEQWQWHYDYPDQGNFGFDSTILDPKKVTDPSLRLLEVDNEVVLPVGENIRVQIAGADVIHSWFVPSLGVQKYAVVGRLNEVWINIEREGVYYGQCNQLCGINHAFMPIKVHAVSKEAFAQWVSEAKQKFAREDDGAPKAQLASTGP